MTRRVMTEVCATKEALVLAIEGMGEGMRETIQSWSELLAERRTVDRGAAVNLRTLLRPRRAAQAMGKKSTEPLQCGARKAFDVVHQLIHAS